MAPRTDAPTLRLATRAKWRAWLAANHERVAMAWLVLYKQHTGKRWLSYDDSVEEALCHGWIDSLTQRIDDDCYRLKMTPRKPKSKWSASNKRRIAKLEAMGSLAEPGARLVAAARADGSWDELPDAERPLAACAELEQALAADRLARAAFTKLPPSHRRQYQLWVASAKRAETRARRAATAIELLRKGEPLGLK